MAELDTLAAVSAPVTVERLLHDLRALGVQRGDTLIVHSAMSKLGWVCGREAAVVQALLRAVGPFGLLVMPAHSGDNSEPAQWCAPPVPESWFAPIRAHMPAYHRRVTVTRGIGRVAECFRTYPGTRRSAHPQVSWCARGLFAAWLLRGHTYRRPGLGIRSPLGRLYRRNAKTLLMGVGYGNCTALHLAEELCPAIPRETLGAAVRVLGRRRWVTFRSAVLDSDRFVSIGQAYEQSGGVVTVGKVAAADCKLLPIRPLVDFGLAWLTAHPSAAPDSGGAPDAVGVPLADSPTPKAAPTEAAAVVPNPIPADGAPTSV